MRFILIMFSLIIFIYSCKLNGYILENKEQYIFRSSYNLSDSLYFEKYIIQGLSYNSLIELPNDSLTDVFTKSINKNDLPIMISPSKSNIDCKKCLTGNIVKYRNININCLKKNVRTEKDKPAILPIIQLSFRKYTPVNSGGSDPYPQYICHLYLAIFIVQNNEIIYYKQMRYVESVDGEYHPYAYEDFHIPIPQKHWDGLFREVMKEYIQRLEWEGC